jgi:predicted O-methyltransferase YrrM
MLRKLWLRWSERNAPTRAEIAAWCAREQTDPSPWARRIDAALWEEAERYAADHKLHAERRTQELGVKLGGAGFYALIYFLTRLVRPQTIVETGVAAGHSSRAFLTALEKNGSGELHSSDFPYFRLADPERFIGSLVEPELREGWHLMIGSDHENLPRIAERLTAIDLLHYDSDKSYHGRDFAMDVLGPKLAPNAVIVFDDIQDNFHFRDFVARRGEPYLVFTYGGKWIGMTGGGERFYGSQTRS